jgi:hypothetical protein
MFTIVSRIHASMSMRDIFDPRKLLSGHIMFVTCLNKFKLGVPMGE